MRFLKKIFDGSYIGEQKKLNGVVLLYNLFNLRNANLQQALEVAGSCRELPGVANRLCFSVPTKTLRA